MESFIDIIPRSVLSWLAIAGFLVAGALAAYGMFDKNARERRKEKDDTAEDVITLLKKKVDILTEDLESLKSEVHTLRTENSVLTRILENRDEQTQKFYQDSYAMMEVVKNNRDISEEQTRILARIVTLLESVVKLN